jgi:hypothetical protein
LGWDRNYNQDYLLLLGIGNYLHDLNVLIGSGLLRHIKDISDRLLPISDTKNGREPEIGVILDTLPLKKIYRRLTTDSILSHGGNTINWMVKYSKSKTRYCC